MTHPLPILPLYTQKRFVEASQKFKIRPYEPKDKQTVSEIFMEGMYEYRNGTNTRPPFPSLDTEHQDDQLRRDPLWKHGFEGYVKYSSLDPNLSDIENYWSLPRRSVFLVAEDETGRVVGTVAIQPGAFSSDKYFHPYVKAIACDVLNNSSENQSSSPNQIANESRNNTTQIPVTARINHTFSWSKISIWADYAMGNLSSQFYCIDDPSYEPTSFALSRASVILLPTPTQINTQIVNQFTQNNTITPPPRSKSTATCQCSQLTSPCRSKTTALFVSRLSPSKQATCVEEICNQFYPLDSSKASTENDRYDPNHYFCPCIRNASHIIDNSIVDNKFPDLCPYCIDDAQYLIQPFIPITDTNDTTSCDSNINISTQYSLNPIVLTYPNIISNTYPLFLLPNAPTMINPETISLSEIYPLQSPLPIYSGTPHGYFKRFLYTNSYPIDRFSSPLPQSLTPNTYLNFLINTSTISSPTQFEHYTTHTEITPDLQNNSPFSRATSNQAFHVDHNNKTIALPFGDICEFRRMSVTLSHRSTGVAYCLMVAALQCAFQVFKFKLLHLSTSSYMTMAIKFYRRFGLFDCFSDWELVNNDQCIPIANYLYNFIPPTIESQFDPATGYTLLYTNSRTYEHSLRTLPWANAFLDYNMQQKQPLLQCVAESPQSMAHLQPLHCVAESPQLSTDVSQSINEIHCVVE